MLVARKALECAERRRLGIDAGFVEGGSPPPRYRHHPLLRPGHPVRGRASYICHGVEGRRMLEAEGLPRHALVCERHTGAGLTVDDIISQRLPLPLRDMTRRLSRNGSSAMPTSSTPRAATSGARKRSTR